jgi:hypothetical protein
MWQTPPAMTPLVQLAVAAGGHVMLHAAHTPTAGALQDAPASAFSFFAAVFFFSEANAGFAISRLVNNATTRRLMVSSLSPLRGPRDRCRDGSGVRSPALGSSAASAS